MNTQHFQDLVRGAYGRKTAYYNTEVVTDDNVADIIRYAISVLSYNKPIIEYLWNYKNGDQPALYRQKTMRDDVNIPVVENRAYEIVQFKNGQTNGEPIQAVSAVQDDRVNKAVEKYNRYCKSANKHRKDIDSGEWTSAVGTGYKAIQRKNGSTPFRIIVPSPLNTVIVYSSITFEPLLAVQVLKDAQNVDYYMAFSETREYRMTTDGLEIKSKLHAFGGIPIVEYPNNQDRISDIELVISILDAINEMQSNRADSVAQFVQSFMKFINCEIDEESFKKLKEMGAISVRSVNGEAKADVEIMSQELKQTETQVYKEDLWDSALSILAIPRKQNGSDGGSTTGAVELRGGWDFSKTRTKLKDPYIIEADKALANVILTVIRQAKGNDDCPLSVEEFDVHIVHSPTDNMFVKVQALQLMMQSGIHPLIAIVTCGLWSDAEKVFLDSKDYLDAIYKTIDDIEGAEEQKAMAQSILDKVGADNGTR